MDRCELLPQEAKVQLLQYWYLVPGAIALIYLITQFLPRKKRTDASRSEDVERHPLWEWRRPY